MLSLLVIGNSDLSQPLLSCLHSIRFPILAGRIHTGAGTGEDGVQRLAPGLQIVDGSLPPDLKAN